MLDSVIRPKHWQLMQVPEHKHSHKNFSFHFVVRFTTLFTRSCEEESTALYLTTLLRDVRKKALVY